MWTNEENPFEWTGNDGGDLKALLARLRRIASELCSGGGRFAIRVPWNERNRIVHLLNREDPTLRESGLLARYRGLGDCGNTLEFATILIQRREDARIWIRQPEDSPAQNDHFGTRFKTLDDLEDNLALDQDDSSQARLDHLKTQCKDWHDPARVDLRDCVASLGAGWELTGPEEIVDGAYLPGDGRPFEPCVRVSDTLSRKVERRTIALWYTFEVSHHQGFPIAA